MRLSLHLAVSVASAIIAGFVVPLPQGGDRNVAFGPLPARALQPASAIVAPAGERAAPPERVAPAGREEIRLSFAPIVKRVAPAVVNVYATARVEIRSPFDDDPFFRHFFGEGGPFGAPRQRERSSLGSGVIVDRSGIVVTNNHVVSDASEVKVALADGREYQAEILLRDERTDLAVLRLPDGGDFPVLDFADSDELEVGDLVLAVGNPFGVGQTVTSGIVSAVARTNVGAGESSFFIQTDAAINPGNSGGALVDLDGALAGINTAIFSRTGGSIGIGFAIPSNMVRTVVAQALAGSTSVARAWIGVACQEVTQEIAASLGIAAPHGALVVQVDEESPGAAAGLRPGDLIIKAGTRDIGDPAAFDYRLAVAGIGNELPLTVWRDGATLALSVVPEEMPGLDQIGSVLVSGRSPLAGAFVADLTATLAERLGIRGGRVGAVVVSVDPASPAARLGLRPGDIVVAAQGEDISSAKELADIASAGGRLWKITIDRGGRVSSLVIGG